LRACGLMGTCVRVRRVAGQEERATGQSGNLAIRRSGGGAIRQFGNQGTRTDPQLPNRPTAQSPKCQSLSEPESGVVESNRWRGVVMIVGAATCWGAMAAVIKLLFRERGVDPLLLVVIRAYLATLILFAGLAIGRAHV